MLDDEVAKVWLKLVTSANEVEVNSSFPVNNVFFTCRILPLGMSLAPSAANSSSPAVPEFIKNWLALPLLVGSVIVLLPAVAGALTSVKPELLPLSLSVMV